MSFADELIRRVEAAKGDTLAQAAVAAESVLEVGPEPERLALRRAVDGAALLHWFDGCLLSQVLGISGKDADLRYGDLKRLPFVEQYRLPSHELCNVHEATRLGWRMHLAKNAPDVFRELSAAASTYFGKDLSIRSKTECVYHLLSADPEAGATELRTLNEDWIDTAPDGHRALAAVVRELEETGLVQGHARVWVLLVIATNHISRGEMERLEALAREIQELALETSDPRAEADAYLLLSEALQAHGDLADSEAAVEAALAICRRWAVMDPQNWGWQRKLVEAQVRNGDVLEARGELDKALDALNEALEIARRLSTLDETNPSRQRGLAVALNRVGNVLELQGRLPEAHERLAEGASVNRRLVEAEPGNSLFQREYATAQMRYGDLLVAQNRLEEGQAALAIAFDISKRLAEQDPTNSALQFDLAAAHNRIGNVLEVRGKLSEAQQSFRQYLAISRHLLAQEPTNMVWQREVAVADNRMGAVLQAQGKLTDAERARRQSLEIVRRLAAANSNATSMHDLGLVARGLARLLAVDGNHKMALLVYEEAARALQASVTGSGTPSAWAQQLVEVESELEMCRHTLSNNERPDGV